MKLFIKICMAVLFLGVSGTFAFRIYQQRDVLLEMRQWIISGKYFFEGIDENLMHQKLKLMDLNFAMPSFERIFKSSLLANSQGLEKRDIEMCRRYYQVVLEDMPQLQEAHVFLGLCEYKAGNVGGAFIEFKKGLESPAGVFWSSYDLGILALMSGHNDAAEAFFLYIVKTPLMDEMKKVYASKLYQQYMQANNITPQKLWEGLNEAHQDAFEKAKFIEQSRAENKAIEPKQEMRIRIF